MAFRGMPLDELCVAPIWWQTAQPPSDHQWCSACDQADRVSSEVRKARDRGFPLWVAVVPDLKLRYSNHSPTWACIVYDANRIFPSSTPMPK